MAAEVEAGMSIDMVAWSMDMVAVAVADMPVMCML
jgi:hypothetical protein